MVISWFIDFLTKKVKTVEECKKFLEKQLLKYEKDCDDKYKFTLNNNKFIIYKNENWFLELYFYVEEEQMYFTHYITFGKDKKTKKTYKINYHIIFPYSLLVKEKHGSYQYLITDIEEEQKIYLKILEQRIKDNWYNEYEEANLTYEEYVESQTELTVKTIETLPEQVTIKHYGTPKDTLKTLLSDYKDIKNNNHNIKLVKKFKDEKNGIKAKEFLLMRSEQGYVYEELEIVNFDNIKYTKTYYQEN